MVRDPRGRLGLAVLACSALGLLVGATLAGAGLADEDQSLGIALVMPSLLLGLALSAVLSPLAAGGGNQLFPPEQLAVYPLRPSTHFRCSLLLTPINLAWIVQVIALAGATTYITGPGPRLLLALGVVAVYIAFVTVIGQAAAWWIVGLRQHRGGRVALFALAGVLVGGTAALLATGRFIDVLDESPTTVVVIASINAYAGPIEAWLPQVILLLVLTGTAYLGGVRACSWTLRSPTALARSQEARAVRRRPRALTGFGELHAVDRANVWRSRSMRRGLYVLGFLPGLVAAFAGVGWVDLPLLPALVAAGAGLLFGVNAFCLDSSGALWLASLPYSPRVAFWVRTVTVLEVGLVTVTIAVVGGMLRADAAPGLAAVLSTVCSGACALAWVTSTCMRLSIVHPHRADLLDPRETPAPPGAMAAYSVRLAAGTTSIGLFFAVIARVGDPLLPFILTAAIVLWCARSVLASIRLWSDVAIRARVVATVSAG